MLVINTIHIPLIPVIQLISHPQLSQKNILSINSINNICPVIAGVGNCPILGILDITLIVAIIDHIPNGWVMFNGDI